MSDSQGMTEARVYLLKLTIILTTIGFPVMMSVIGPVILLLTKQTTLTPQ